MKKRVLIISLELESCKKVREVRDIFRSNCIANYALKHGVEILEAKQPNVIRDTKKK